MDSDEGEIQQHQEFNARLKDLCESDKKKVGELMKKLASEKEEKQLLHHEMVLREKNYEKTIANLKKESQECFKGTLEIQEDLKSSLNLLKSVGVRISNFKI